MAIGSAQLTYNLEPAIARAGMAGAFGPHYDMTKQAMGPLHAGVGCFLVPGFGPSTHPRQGAGHVWNTPSPADPAASVNAFVTTHASVNAGVTISGAGLNGAVGAGSIYPPRKITITLNSHADWDLDAAGWTVTFVDGGTKAQVTEVLSSPDGGNATLTTTGYAESLVSVTQSDAAVSSTNGSYTIGYAALDASIVASDFAGIVLLDTATVESSYPPPTLATDSLYLDGATVAVRREGSIWVVTEDACSEGGAVYCRTAANGALTQLGGIRSDADTANAFVIPGARFERNSSALGLNKVRLAY
jgi:hypothetical protein